MATTKKIRERGSPFVRVNQGYVKKEEEKNSNTPLELLRRVLGDSLVEGIVSIKLEGNRRDRHYAIVTEPDATLGVADLEKIGLKATRKTVGYGIRCKDNLIVSQADFEGRFPEVESEQSRDGR